MYNTKLLTFLQSKSKRPTGVEPASQAWEAWVMPLYDGRDISASLRDVRCGCRRLSRRCL